MLYFSKIYYSGLAFLFLYLFIYLIFFSFLMELLILK